MLDLYKFKQRIKERCAQTGVSQSFLCEKVGRQRTYLNNIWRGTTTPSDNDIRQFAELLSTTPAYLRGEIDNPVPPAADGDWVDEIKISPAKLACAKQIARLSDAHAEVMSGLFEFNEEDIRAVARALVLFKNRGE